MQGIIPVLLLNSGVQARGYAALTAWLFLAYSGVHSGVCRGVYCIVYTAFTKPTEASLSLYRPYDTGYERARPLTN
jgi:hypothetical protein